jgi:hypothetical protein
MRLPQRQGQARSGDVDDDGRADRVTLRRDRCRHRLVAELQGGATVRVRVRPLSWPGTDPRLIKLAEIYRPGAVYSLRNDKLRRLRRTDARPAAARGWGVSCK